jgi:hypothetical protein
LAHLDVLVNIDGLVLVSLNEAPDKRFTQVNGQRAEGGKDG